MDSSDILLSLAEVGKLFYDTMLGRLNSGVYPTDNPERGFTSIQNATVVQSPVKDGTRYYVNIVISLRKAPYARAYEWGSGEHGPEGTTYPIDPVNARMMVFPEVDWPNWEPWPPNGRGGAVPFRGIFMLGHVDHPGVEAEPYIVPTIEQIHDDVRKKLVHDFKASILKNGKMVEVIK